MYRFAVVAYVGNAVARFIDHLLPATEIEISRSQGFRRLWFTSFAFAAKLFINRMNITGTKTLARLFTTEGWDILKGRLFFFQRLQLPAIQTILHGSAAKNEVDILAFYGMIENMMCHRAEGSNPRTGANQEQVAIDRLR